MKVLTLWQPWASLMALGAKTIETRSWSTSYRGPVAIHASVRENVVRKSTRTEQRLLVLGDYTVERDGAGLLLRGQSEGIIGHPYRLPLGTIVATGNLVDVVPTDSMWPCDPGQWGDDDEDEEHLRLAGWGGTNVGTAEANYFVATSQLPYGDYTSGRFAWLFDDLEPVRSHVPLRGAQGLRDLPAEVADELRYAA